MDPRPDHLLLVDDDRQLLALLADYLRAAGYRVSTATQGREMRAVLAAQAIDLVVLDVMLPGEDGLALCRDLRSREVEPLPVLMLTARGDEADRVLGLEMGADDYLARAAGAHPRRAAPHAPAAAAPGTAAPGQAAGLQ
jgi:two-component system OmpR family response regulator